MSEQPGPVEGYPQWTPPGATPPSEPPPSVGPPPSSGPPSSGPPAGQSFVPAKPISAGPAYPPTAYPPASYPPTAYPPASYPPAGYPPGAVAQLAPPQLGAPAGARQSAPVHVEPVRGTQFGVAYLSVPPTVAGLAIGCLVAGIGSVAVALVVGCFGVAGASGGWGPLVAGAFAIPAGLVGLAGMGLGLAAMRQIRNGRGRITGRGLAVAGMICGGVGALLTAGGMAISLAALAA